MTPAIFVIVKSLHLLALAFGASASLGNIYVLLAKGPHDLPAPGFVGSLRNIQRLIALGAIILLWLTGLALMLLTGQTPEGSAFNIKLLAALILLALIGFINYMAPRWARRGGPPSYLAALHITGAILLLVTIILAVAAFH